MKSHERSYNRGHLKKNKKCLCSMIQRFRQGRAVKGGSRVGADIGKFINFSSFKLSFKHFAITFLRKIPVLQKKFNGTFLKSVVL